MAHLGTPFLCNPIGTYITNMLFKSYFLQPISELKRIGVHKLHSWVAHWSSPTS